MTIAFKKIYPVGISIFANTKQLQDQLDKMALLSPNCFKPYILHSVFLKDVLQDETAAFSAHCIAKVKIENMVINKKLGDDIDVKYGSNSSAAVIIISGSISNIGTVLNVNQEIFTLLGYNKEELVNRNISEMMPSIIGEMHNKLIAKGVKSSANKNNPLLVYALHNKGYIIPCKLLYKLISNSEEGIKIIGFLNISSLIVDNAKNKIRNAESCAFLCDVDMRVLGVNASTFSILEIPIGCTNIKRYMQDHSKLSLYKLYPTLFTNDNTPAITSVGLNEIIDLFQLRNQIMSIMYEENTDSPIKPLPHNKETTLQSSLVVIQSTSIKSVKSKSINLVTFSLQGDDTTRGEVSYIQESNKNYIIDINYKATIEHILSDDQGSVTNSTSSGIIDA
jgi:PAS domain S-box-containing protein